MNKPLNKFNFFIALALCFAGCSSSQGNIGQMQKYSTPVLEAEWIRNGEPLLFQGASWYPLDDIEVFQDFEMLFVGKYEGVDFFVEKSDVKPYSRLFTKFGANQFRPFEKQKSQ